MGLMEGEVGKKCDETVGGRKEGEERRNKTEMREDTDRRVREMRGQREKKRGIEGKRKNYEQEMRLKKVAIRKNE